MSTCGQCSGAGGKTETETEVVGGVTVTRQVWRTCTACSGR